MFDVAKTFQAEYARKTERMTKNESAAYEKKLFELTEGFSNFNNSGAYINPTNYQVSLAKKEKVETADGGVIYKMSNNPSDFFTVAELNTFASADVDRFDVAGAVSKIASEIGQRVNQTYSMDPSKRSFIIQAVSDPTGDVYEKMYRDGDLTKDDIDVVIKFREQIKAEIGAITGNELNALSVYTDSMVGFKDFTFNEDEQGDGMVLLEKDPAGGLPMPNFKNKKGEELLIDIEKNILNRIKVRLDQSVTATGTQIREYSKSLSEAQTIKLQGQRNNALEFVRHAWELYTSPVNDIKGSEMNYFTSRDPKREAGESTIDGEEFNVPLKDGKFATTSTNTDFNDFLNNAMANTVFNLDRESARQVQFAKKQLANEIGLSVDEINAQRFVPAADREFGVTTSKGFGTENVPYLERLDKDNKSVSGADSRFYKRIETTYDDDAYATKSSAIDGKFREALFSDQSILKGARREGRLKIPAANIDKDNGQYVSTVVYVDKNGTPNIIQREKLYSATFSDQSNLVQSLENAEETGRPLAGINENFNVTTIKGAIVDKKTGKIKPQNNLAKTLLKGDLGKRIKDLGFEIDFEGSGSMMFPGYDDWAKVERKYGRDDRYTTYLKQKEDSKK